MSERDRVAAALAAAAITLVTAGVALAWNPAAGLIALGLMLGTLAVMLGTGEDTTTGREHEAVE